MRNKYILVGKLKGKVHFGDLSVEVKGKVPPVLK
jgi:hypothetical protein